MTKKVNRRIYRGAGKNSQTVVQMEPIQLRKKPPRQSGPKKKPRGLPFDGSQKSPGRPKRPTSIPLPKGTREAFTVLSDYAFEALGKILNDPWHPRHEQATEYVLNQKWGTARQHVEISDPNNALGGRHELSITFANAPTGGSVAVTRVGVDTNPKPWDIVPVASTEPLAPAQASAKQEAPAVVNHVPLAVVSAMPFVLPWERESDEDDD